MKNPCSDLGIINKTGLVVTKAANKKDGRILKSHRQKYNPKKPNTKLMHAGRPHKSFLKKN
jgi:hypothetical protein